jgi:hypothetical protein
MLSKCLFKNIQKRLKFVSIKYFSNLNKTNTKTITTENNEDDFKDTKKMDKYLDEKMVNIDQTLGLVKVITARPLIFRYYVPHLSILFLISGPEILLLYQAFWALFPFAAQVNYRALINPDIREQLYIIHHLLEEQDKKSSEEKKDYSAPKSSEFINVDKYKNLAYTKFLNKLLFIAFFGLSLSFFSLFIFSELKNKFIVTEYYLHKKGYSNLNIDNCIEGLHKKLPMIYAINWCLIVYCNFNKHSKLLITYKLNLIGIFTAIFMILMFNYRYNDYLESREKNKINTDLKSYNYLDAYFEKVKTSYLLELNYLKEFANSNSI